MKEELMLNETAYNAEQEDYDAIKQAIESLSKSSQKQFEEIKKEKWYNRVFDMITFSQKGKKRLAEQIGTVAQAQQIFVELLLRLSSDDANVSKIVAESMDDIRRIQEQNIYLLSKINQLENISLGIKADMDINKLSDKCKQVLTACLYKINGMNNKSSEAQMNYANAAITYLAVDVQMDNPTSVFDAMDIDSKRRIFSCCMEYIFLRDCTFDACKEYEEFIEEFDFGNKTIDAIKEQIMQLYSLRGSEGFYSKYKVDNFEDIEDVFVVDIELQEEAEVDEGEPTDENIASILQISLGETKTYRNKKLHINAYINCEGTLNIEHCILYYNESDAGDEITLGKGAHLTIEDSVVVCMGYDKHAFISCEGENTIHFKNTTFVNCSFFLKSREECAFSMMSCELRNCNEEFISLYITDKIPCSISDNVILQDGLADFQPPSTSRMRSSHMIDINSNKNAEIQFHNNVIIEDPQFKTAVVNDQSLENRLCYLRCNRAEISNCTFVGLSSNIVAPWIKNSVFKDCTEAIQTIHEWRNKEKMPLVDNCMFENSTNIIEADDNTAITNCQFMSCYNNLIKPVYSGGGIKIDFCQFGNIKNTLEGYDCFLSERACITLRRSKGSESRPNFIEKCIFDGAELNDNFLISASGYEKPSGTVINIQECDFRNCSTKRSTQKIIKEYMQYDSWGKTKDFHANQISNCRGLDKVNKEGGETEDIEIPTKTTAGIPIGSSIATGIATFPIGAPEVLCVLAGISNVNKVQKEL